jgi:hypothetical protein
MASYVLVRHKVTDFGEWKPVYDDHLPMRVAAGLTEKALLWGADDPDEVVVLFEAEDLDRARAFVASADLKETMQKAGVVGAPDISFLNG